MVSTDTKSLREKMKHLSDLVIYSDHLVHNDTPLGTEIYSTMAPPAKATFSEMAKCFEPQREGAFCGIASAAICLKYLLGVSPNFTQDALYRNHVRGKLWKTKTDIRYGLTLSQISSLVLSGGGTALEAAEVQMSDPAELEKAMLQDLAIAFSDSGLQSKCLIINFYRVFKEHWGGHFCPISGYARREGVDYVFILDVAAHRTQPHWFPVKQLIPLMCRFDGPAPRGYILISKVLKHVH